MGKNILLVPALAAFYLSSVIADEGAHEHHHHEAPAADAGQHIHHTHTAGSWMFEYKYMSMGMDGNQSGTKDISVNALTQPGGSFSFGAAPESMNMNMHMIMGMYGINNKLTAMVMFHMLDNSMDMVTRPDANGVRHSSTMTTSGMGDTFVGLMYSMNAATTASVNISMPTGSTDEDTKMTMVMPMDPDGPGPMGPMPMAMKNQPMPAPYKMQLGTGTFDIILSVTYKKAFGRTTWTTQGSYRLHTGENAQGYTRGDIFSLGSGIDYQMTPKLTTSLRGLYRWEDNIDGFDPALEQRKMMSPTFNSQNQGGTLLSAGIGAAYQVGKASLVGAELSSALRQDLDGPQMASDLTISLSAQLSF